ncbi:MAG: haloacid dehalogenase type II [Magnetospiraceae bacterium]
METSQSAQSVKVVVFDAYGTLFDVASAAASCADVLGDKVAPLAALWRTKQLEYTWLRSLMGGPFRDFWDITSDGLDFALDQLGLTDPALRHRLMDLYLNLSAYPEVPQMLATLRERGFKTAILSNGARAMLESAVTSAGLADKFDTVLCVDSLKIYKPHPSVYQLATDHFNVAAGEICFLSSNAWDVAGAASFGFRVIWVNRFGQPAERLPGTPVAILADLRALPDQLAAQEADRPY